MDFVTWHICGILYNHDALSQYACTCFREHLRLIWKRARRHGALWRHSREVASLTILVWLYTHMVPGRSLTDVISFFSFSLSFLVLSCLVLPLSLSFVLSCLVLSCLCPFRSVPFLSFPFLSFSFLSFPSLPFFFFFSFLFLSSLFFSLLFSSLLFFSFLFFSFFLPSFLSFFLSFVL